MRECVGEIYIWGEEAEDEEEKEEKEAEDGTRIVKQEPIKVMGTRTH